MLLPDSNISYHMSYISMFGMKRYLYGIPPKKEKKKKEGKLGWHDIGLYGGGFYFLGLWGLPLAWGLDKLYHYGKNQITYPMRDIRQSFEPEFQRIREMQLGNRYFNEINDFMASWTPDKGYSEASTQNRIVNSPNQPDPIIEALKKRLN